MAEQQAKVTSVDAIEQFRSTLIQYLSKARPTLEEIVSEVTRAKSWLQNDQRQLWERQLKARNRDLEHAQAELFSARLSLIQTASASQQMAVHRAQAAICEAEQKLQAIKKWDREIDNRSDPMVKEIDQLHGFLTADMNKAIIYLTEIVKSLQAYAESTGGKAGAPLPEVAPPNPETEKSN